MGVVLSVVGSFNDRTHIVVEDLIIVIKRMITGFVKESQASVSAIIVQHSVLLRDSF